MNKREIIKNAQEMKPMLNNLEEVVKFLEEKKLKNENVVIKFNGQKLYSLIDDENSCYKKVTGETKKAFNKGLKKEREDKEKTIKEATEKAQELMKSKQKLFQPKLMAKLNNSIDMCIKVGFDAKDVSHVFEIMEILHENKTEFGMEKALNKLLGEKKSSHTFLMMLEIIVGYSKRGVEFYEYLLQHSKENVSYPFLNKLVKQQKLNSGLENVVEEEKV